MSSPAEVQAATVQALISGWKAWTPADFLATWADECTQQTLPFSYGVQLRTKAHCEHIFPTLMTVLTDFDIQVHNIVQDVPARKAVIYALAKANAPWGPYQNEHTLFLWFNETRDKIVKIEEMFDTTVMKEVLPKLDQYIVSSKQSTEKSDVATFQNGTQAKEPVQIH